MKTVVMIIVAMFHYFANAQSPTPDLDTLSDPVKQIDPEVKHMPIGLYDASEMVRIHAEELPTTVLKILKTSEYNGWQKSVVYKHKSKDLFFIEVRDGGKSRTYSFTKDGKRTQQETKKIQH
jgi:hypothetical protein